MEACLSIHVRGLRSVLCEIIDDRAIRSVITLTVCDEMLERMFHRFQLSHLELKRIDMFQCQRPDFGAGSVRVTPQSQKPTDTFNRKTESAAAMDAHPCLCRSDTHSRSGLRSG
jgi:hypothetical protein